MKKLLFLAGVIFMALISGKLLAQPTVTVSGNIVANTTWHNDTVYLLSNFVPPDGGFIYVTGNATLTIEAGTLVKGNGTSLVITRGSKIIAQGTPEMPIVFTSNQAAGFRGPADWGGIIICGNATINDPAGFRVAEGGIDPVMGQYGGTNDADNSGILQYVRIEFGGIAQSAIPNSETNGLTMGGVGSGTTIDHVQVSYGGDDMFEWFGGTVNAKHLIAYGAIDDDFDTDYGYRGKVQFAVSLRDSLLGDASGSNGFESDNDATGTTNTPITKPIFSNISIFGPKTVTGSTGYNANYRRALHLRRSSRTCTYNSVFTGFPTGLKIENSNTGANVTSGELQFKNNIIAGCNTPLDSSALTFGMVNWFNTNANTIYSSPTAVMANNPYSYTNPDFTPQSGSPLLSGSDFSSANLTGGFFTSTSYVGAFGSDDWTDCWGEWNPNLADYSIVPINYDVASPSLTTSGSTTFCQGDNVIISAPSGFARYLWSNGAITQSIVATTAGNYSCTVWTTRGCSAVSNVVNVIVNNAIATISPSATIDICQGDVATLTANNGSAYAWAPGGEITQSMTTSISGTYSVTVTNSVNGCTATASATVTVHSNPSPTITPLNSTTICDGGNVILLSSPASVYTWSVGGNTQSISVTTGGPVSVTVEDAYGCQGTSTPTTITVNSNPTAVLTNLSSTSFCTGDSVRLVAAPPGISYLWSTGETNDTIAVYSSSVISVTVTDANSCSDQSGTVNINVSNAPAPSISLSGNATFCEGDSVILTSSASDSYLWNTGANTQTITAFNTGNYSVTVTNADICNGVGTSNPEFINASPLPVAFIAVTGNPEICPGSSITLTSNEAPEYLWSTGGTGQSIVVNSPGSYSVTITNLAGCEGPSAPVHVTVSDMPASGFTWIWDGLTVHLFSNAMNATYLNWSFGDGTPISSAANPTHTYAANDTYVIKLEASNDCGMDADSQTVSLNVGLDEPSNDAIFSVAPNPASSEVVILPGQALTEDFTLEIYHLSGKLVMGENRLIPQGSTGIRMDVSGLEQGVYFVRPLSESGISGKAFKLIVIR